MKKVVITKFHPHFNIDEVVNVIPSPEDCWSKGNYHAKDQFGEYVVVLKNQCEDVKEEYNPFIREKSYVNTVNTVLTEVLAQGYTLLAIKPVSKHPDDAHLAIVLVKRFGDDYQPFVTYLFNAEFSSFNNGKYFEDMLDACHNFEERN